MAYPDQKKYYPFMDGLRAIAVYWVVLHHIYRFFDIHVLVRLASCGNLGVDMFFVISGFLITGLLIGDIQGHVRVKRFYIRRFFKIVPQYFFAVIIALLFYETFSFGRSCGIFNTPCYVKDAVPISYFLFLQNYFPQVPMLSHTWSLAIEEHFYFFYPLLLLLICKIEPDKTRRYRLTIWACVGILVICNVIRFLYFKNGTILFSGLLRSPHVFQTTLFRIDELAAGCLLKLLEGPFNKVQAAWKYIAPASFVLGMLIYLLFVFNVVSIGNGLLDRYWFAYTLAYLAPALIFISAYAGFVPVKWLTENPLLRFVGRNSYGIYLWHYILIFPVSWFIHGDAGMVICLYVVIATVFGIASTMTIEKFSLSLRARIAP